MGVKDIKLSPEALAFELSDSGGGPGSITPKVYDEMGEVLNTIKEDKDYKNLFDASLRDIKRKEKLLYKKMMRLWMFDALECEYYYRKEAEKTTTSPLIKKDVPPYFSAYFHEVMFNLIKDDMKDFQPERYRQRLYAIYVTTQQKKETNGGSYVWTKNGIAIITKPKKSKKR